FLKRGNHVHRLDAERAAALIFVLESPTLRPLSAMDTPEENSAGCTRHTEFMPSGQVAANQVPHEKAPSLQLLGAHPVRIFRGCAVKRTYRHNWAGVEGRIRKNMRPWRGNSIWMGGNTGSSPTRRAPAGRRK